MSNDELKNMINMFIDNELDEPNEPYLFTALSSDPDARMYFKKLHSLRTAAIDSIELFPQSLEDKILSSTKHHYKKTYNPPKYSRSFSRFISVAAAAILLILCSFLFLELKSYKNDLLSVTDRFNEQKDVMNLIVNKSIPDIIISPDTKNEIIVSANPNKRL